VYSITEKETTQLEGHNFIDLSKFSVGNI